MKSRKRHSSSSAPVSDPPGGMGKDDGGSKNRAHIGEDGDGSKKRACIRANDGSSNKRARDKEDDAISMAKRTHRAKGAPIGSGRSSSSSSSAQFKESLDDGKCGKHKLARVPIEDDDEIKAKYIVSEDMDPKTLLANIEELLSAVTLSIVEGKGFIYKIPSRNPRRMAYSATHGIVHERGEFITLDFSKNFSKAIQLTSTLSAIAETIRNGVSVTKRFMYYRHKEIFDNEGVTNTMLDHICCMFGCTMSSLNVCIEPTGSVIGPLKVKFRNKKTLDCSVDWDGFGHRIPRTVSIESFEHHAKRILVVEKKAIFHHLLQMNFHIEQSCIIITGKREPDIATRSFFHKLHGATNLPVYALMDPDPYGVQILFVYTFGSINMSYTSGMAVPEIQWIGLWHSDLLDVLSNSCFTETTPSEKKMLENLLQHDILGIAQQHWGNRIRQMLLKKASMEALFSKKFSYLSKELLPALFERKVFEDTQLEQAEKTKKMCCKDPIGL